MSGLHFEVGQDLGPLRVAVDRAQIDSYAEASGDHNPIHLDEEFARTVGLPGVISHGMLQMGRLATFVTSVAGDHHRIRMLSCRFAAVVRPGDVVTFAGRVATIEGERVTIEVWAENQDGKRVLTKGSAELELS